MNDDITARLDALANDLQQQPNLIDQKLAGVLMTIVTLRLEGNLAEVERLSAVTAALSIAAIDRIRQSLNWLEVTDAKALD